MISNVADFIMTIDTTMASIVGLCLAIITFYFIFRDAMCRFWQASLHAVQESIGRGENDRDQTVRLINRYNSPHRD